MLAAIEAVGDNGAFQIMKVISEALGLGCIEIDVQMVSRWAGVKKDRAQRLLLHAQAILDASQEIPQKTVGNLKKSTKNLEEISENVTEISENLLDFDTSNPGGCIKDRENRENREIKEKNKKEKLTVASPEAPQGSVEKIGTRLNPSWTPSQELLDWAENKRPDLELTSVGEAFVDYWIAKPGKDGIKLSWEATFRNWIRRSLPGNKPLSPKPKPPKHEEPEPVYRLGEVDAIDYIAGGRKHDPPN